MNCSSYTRFEVSPAEKISSGLMGYDTVWSDLH